MHKVPFTSAAGVQMPFVVSTLQQRLVCRCPCGLRAGIPQCAQRRKWAAMQRPWCCYLRPRDLPMLHRWLEKIALIYSNCPLSFCNQNKQFCQMNCLTCQGLRLPSRHVSFLQCRKFYDRLECLDKYRSQCVWKPSKTQLYGMLSDASVLLCRIHWGCLRGLW